MKNKHISLSTAIGRAICERRIRHNLSQTDLAEVTGLARSYIGDVERGARTVSVINLSKLAEGLKFKSSSLLLAAEKIVQTGTTDHLCKNQNARNTNG